MKIFIGADIVPTQSNIEAFSSGHVSAIIDENIEKKLKEADFRVFNLETPLADKETPIKKYGPNLIAPTACITGIKKLGVDLFTLANNHIMDHGAQGLNSTVTALNESGIAYVGAGDNLGEAQKPYIIEKDGVKAGIYACAEHEFSIAGENSPGANPFEPLDSLDHIVELKEKCDYVIVLYHGGKEHYRYPSPYLRKVCRKMCDKGADIVICQHSHCVGCEEKYEDSTIVYGQGNFIFDACSDEYWDTAVLMLVNLAEKAEIEYIALEKTDGKVNMSDNKDILMSFKERSEQIKTPGFVEKAYDDFAQGMSQQYIKTLSGVGIFFRIINKLCGYKLKKRVSEKRKLAIGNFIECEAHRELILRGLKK